MKKALIAIYVLVGLGYGTNYANYKSGPVDGSKIARGLLNGAFWPFSFGGALAKYNYAK